MRRVVVFIALCPILCGLAAAQDYWRAEVFAGPSYLNSDKLGLNARQNFNGWESAVAFRANKWVGGEADFSGYYSSVTASFGNLISERLTLSEHNYVFLGGPRVIYKLVFLHALFGLSRLSASGSGFSSSPSSFAAAFGGGVERTVSNHWGIRMSADYLHTRNDVFGGTSSNMNNVRVSAGVVYGFGRRTVHRLPPPVPVPAGIRVPGLGVIAVTYVTGAQITEVAPGSPAELAGIAVGDVVNSVDGVAVSTAAELAAQIARRSPGTKVRMGYLIKGNWQTESVVILQSSRRP